MNEYIDIRNRKNLSENDILSLNFINDSSPYAFRKYYRSGLRSHIFEVLAKQELDDEINGVMDDGILTFPRARPIKVFRIFRNRFRNIEEIFLEIKKYNLLLDVLGPELIAQSEEFIVDYFDGTNNHILLCGLQDYVEGEILDPWKIFGTTHLKELSRSMADDNSTQKQFVRTAKTSIESFIKGVRKMIFNHRYIPDLAGIGNLILTGNGLLKLVDINNIVTIDFDEAIPIDDKGYPACDVSVHVLHILEEKLLGKTIREDDPLYHFFLKSERTKAVKQLEKQFYASL